MATSYVTELGDRSSLPQEERESFYNKLKPTVVITSIRDNKKVLVFGGGICVRSDGLVLCALRRIGTKPKELKMKFGELASSPAELVYYDSEMDLALLLPKRLIPVKLGEAPLHAMPYVSFCSASDIRVGKETLCISHTGKLVHSLTLGQIAYPASTLVDLYPLVSCLERSIDRRRMGDLLEEKDPGLNPWSGCRADLHVLQISNIHGGPEASGCPIFSSAGLVMGMRIFDYAGFDFCVHVDTLQNFISNWKEKDEANSQSTNMLKSTSKDRSERDKRKVKRTSLTSLKTEPGNARTTLVGQTENSTHRREGSKNKSDCLRKYSQNTVPTLSSVHAVNSVEVATGHEFSTSSVDSSDTQKHKLLLPSVRFPLSHLPGQIMTARTLGNISQKSFPATEAKKVLHKFSVERQGNSWKDRKMLTKSNIKVLSSPSLKSQESKTDPESFNPSKCVMESTKRGFRELEILMHIKAMF